jgi:hypothetical protein
MPQGVDDTGMCAEQADAQQHMKKLNRDSTGDSVGLPWQTR